MSLSQKTWRAYRSLRDGRMGVVPSGTELGDEYETLIDAVELEDAAEWVNQRCGRERK